jgi:hypothetical protein
LKATTSVMVSMFRKQQGFSMLKNPFLKTTVSKKNTCLQDNFYYVTATVTLIYRMFSLQIVKFY